MNAGHHGKLTWRHLLGPREKSEHYGGFAIELGIRWSEKRHGLEDADAAPGVPEWAKWTGDPFYDCYSHVEPGTQAIYSSAGYWRLGQALTALWVRDLKDGPRRAALRGDRRPGRPLAMARGRLD